MHKKKTWSLNIAAASNATYVYITALARLFQAMLDCFTFLKLVIGGGFVLSEWFLLLNKHICRYEKLVNFDNFPCFAYQPNEMTRNFWKIQHRLYGICLQQSTWCRKGYSWGLAMRQYLGTDSCKTYRNTRKITSGLLSTKSDQKVSTGTV